MNFNNRINKMMKLVNTDDDKKPVLIFKKVDDLYITKVDKIEYILKENELEEFKKEYGTDNVVSLIDNIPKGNDYIPLDK